MVNHCRQRPQYAVLFACLIGLIVYFADDLWSSLVFWFSLNLALVIGLLELLALVTIPVALFRYLWLAGSRLKDRRIN